MLLINQAISERKEKETIVRDVNNLNQFQCPYLLTQRLHIMRFNLLGPTIRIVQSAHFNIVIVQTH